MRGTVLARYGTILSRDETRRNETAVLSPSTPPEHGTAQGRDRRAGAEWEGTPACVAQVIGQFGAVRCAWVKAFVRGRGGGGKAPSGSGGHEPSRTHHQLHDGSRLPWLRNVLQRQHDFASNVVPLPSRVRVLVWMDGACLRPEDWVGRGYSNAGSCGCCIRIRVCVCGGLGSLPQCPARQVAL